MKTSARITFSAITLLGSIPGANLVAKVDEQLIGRTDSDTKFVVSHRGVHTAAITRKGSKWAVVVDGVAGPRIDEVLGPSSLFVDTRGLQGPDARAGSGRHQPDQRTTQLVTFCEDGSHFAYLARQSEEWVLMRDDREVLRMPASVGRGFRIQFTSRDGKHLLFALENVTPLGSELWLDGKKWPGGYLEEPLISPDGEHVACPINLGNDKRTLILDGKDLGYYAEKLTFTSDSKHLVGQSPTPKGTALVVDGKPVFTATHIAKYVVAPNTHRIAAVLMHKYPNSFEQGEFVLLDGKPVEPTLCKGGVKWLGFSPDGKHWAAVCSQSPTTVYVVHDGKKGQDYQGVGPIDMPGITGIAFSPDSSRLVYLALGAGKTFVVNNGEESDDGYDSLGFRFAPVGSRFAYVASTFGRREPKLWVDGKTVQVDQGANIDSFDFSPDASRHAILSIMNFGAGGVAIDGTKSPFTAMNFWFSPDSKHIAVSGYQDAGNLKGLWIDGVLVHKAKYAQPALVAFSANGQHVFWSSQEPDPDRKDGNYFLWVTYADGLPVVRFDAFTGNPLLRPSGYSQATIPPGWQTVGESSLACVGPVVGGEMKRFMITPTDTSLDALLVEANNGDATKKKITTAAPPAPSAQPNIPATPAASGAGAAANHVANATPAIPGILAATPATPATPASPAADPAAAAAKKATQKVDDAAAKARAWIDSLTKKK